MNNSNSSFKYSMNESEIDLLGLLKILWIQKNIVISITLLSCVLVVIYSLSLPNIYTSKALVSPVQTDMNQQNPLGRYGGFASFAGINIQDKTAAATAVETLNSLKFFEESFLPNINLEDLMAVNDWNSSTNKLSYDNKVFDFDNKLWIREVSFPKEKTPSAQEAHRKFNDGHFSLYEDKDTGFITLHIKHHSPYIAQSWLNTILVNINKTIRTEQKIKTLTSIDFLNQQLIKTQYTEVKQALSFLLQQETEKLMLIESNQDYVFKTIDPPAVPELKSGPSRSLICIIGALIGGILSVIVALLNHYIKNRP